MERRSSQRIRRRAECTIRRGRESHEGTILDISEGGLAAICEVPLEQGSIMTIEFSGLGPSLEVKAVVWHCRPVRYRGAESFAHGFMLDHAPPEYQRLIASSQRGSRPEKAATKPIPEAEPELERKRLEHLRGELDEAMKESRKASPEPAFRVRAKQRNRPRTKTLSLTAATEDDVREAVRASLGDEWEILEVTPAA